MGSRISRRRAYALLTVGFALVSSLGLMASSGSAFDPGVPLTANPVRSGEPVVLTGTQFPAWSAGHAFTFHETMSPLTPTTPPHQTRHPNPPPTPSTTPTPPP